MNARPVDRRKFWGSSGAALPPNCHKNVPEVWKASFHWSRIGRMNGAEAWEKTKQMTVKP